MTIRVLIVDDHAVVRAGLHLLLDAEDDIETVGEAGDARQAIFEARSTKPDIVLMDVVLGDESGIDLTPELLHEQPQARVLVLSMQDDPRYVREAFAAGSTRLCAEGSRRHRAGHGHPRNRARRELRPPRAWSADGGRRRGGCGCRRARPTLGS